MLDDRLNQKEVSGALHMAWFLDGDKALRRRQDAAPAEGGYRRSPNGTLQELYFDVSKDVAYALFKDLGDSLDTKRLTLELGGVQYAKMLDAQQADPLYTEQGAQA